MWETLELYIRLTFPNPNSNCTINDHQWRWALWVHFGLLIDSYWMISSNKIVDQYLCTLSKCSSQLRFFWWRYLFEVEATVGAFLYRHTLIYGSFSWVGSKHSLEPDNIPYVHVRGDGVDKLPDVQRIKSTLSLFGIGADEIQEYQISWLCLTDLLFACCFASFCCLGHTQKQCRSKS